MDYLNVGRPASAPASEKTAQPATGTLQEDLEVDNSKSVLNKIATLYAEQLMSDLTLEVGGATFPAHRLILCASSEVFQVMLMSREWTEWRESRILLQETEAAAKVFPHFLKYFYTGQIRISHHTVLPVLSLADKYNDLVTLCLRYMSQHIAQAAKLGCLVSWMQYTMACGHDHVAKVCQNFVKWNLEWVCIDSALAELEPDALLALLQHSDLVLHNEMTLYRFVVRWCEKQREKLEASEFNEAERKAHWDHLVVTVFSHVRFPMMCPNQLAKLLLCPLTQEHKDFFMERMAIAMSYQSGQLERVASVQESEGGRLLFTPRLYTEDTWGSLATVDNFHSLPSYHTRTFIFSTRATIAAASAATPALEWTLDLYPKGVWFQKSLMIVWGGTYDVPEVVLRTVRISITSQSVPEPTVNQYGETEDCEPDVRVKSEEPTVNQYGETEDCEPDVRVKVNHAFVTCRVDSLNNQSEEPTVNQYGETEHCEPDVRVKSEEPTVNQYGETEDCEPDVRVKVNHAFVSCRVGSLNNQSEEPTVNQYGETEDCEPDVRVKVNHASVLCRVGSLNNQSEEPTVNQYGETEDCEPDVRVKVNHAFVSCRVGSLNNQSEEPTVNQYGETEDCEPDVRVKVNHAFVSCRVGSLNNQSEEPTVNQYGETEDCEPDVRVKVNHAFVSCRVGSLNNQSEEPTVNQYGETEDCEPDVRVKSEEPTVNQYGETDNCEPDVRVKVNHASVLCRVGSLNNQSEEPTVNQYGETEDCEPDVRVKVNHASKPCRVGSLNNQSEEPTVNQYGETNNCEPDVRVKVNHAFGSCRVGSLNNQSEEPTVNQYGETEDCEPDVRVKSEEPTVNQYGETENCEPDVRVKVNHAFVTCRVGSLNNQSEEPTVNQYGETEGCEPDVRVKVNHAFVTCRVGSLNNQSEEPTVNQYGETEGCEPDVRVKSEEPTVNQYGETEDCEPDVRVKSEEPTVNQYGETEDCEPDVRVKIGILVWGVQKGVEHVAHVVERVHRFSALDRVLNIDGALDFDELNTPLYTPSDTTIVGPSSNSHARCPKCTDGYASSDRTPNGPLPRDHPGQRMTAHTHLPSNHTPLPPQ
ncbi:BTB/POZ domain-containing protein [Phthorimaea operculella]|nr:BTB/POZ domain-containing protein [Phthorimaea operculella]